MRSKWILAPLIFGALLLIFAAILATHWPFTRAKVIEALREQAEGDVTIGEFRETFFPHPGCVARQVTIHHGANPAEPPIVTVDTLELKGSYSALLTFSKTLAEIRTDGMRIHVPAQRKTNGGGSGSASSPSIGMDRFVADHALLEFALKDGGPPFVIRIHHVELSPAAPKRKMHFATTLAIPEPEGEVAAQGDFGPWDRKDPYRTPVSGTYRLSKANLATFSGIAGELNSEGRFGGEIDHIDVGGDISAADFEVRAAKHKTPLRTRFSAMVNGRTGEVELRSVESAFLRTVVFSEGAVAAPKEDEPKQLTLDMAVNSGRIQDLLTLVDAGRPDLTGIVSLRFHVRLGPGKGSFLQKLRLSGEFGIGDARFTNSATQQSVEHISMNAYHGESDPADVVSNLRGRVSTANGVAKLTDISFDVPGATAHMNGTYELLTHRVDLRGTVRLEESLSKTTTGVKSFLLKALDPFFRKRKHLTVAPVRISGVPGHTSVQLNL